MDIDENIYYINPDKSMMNNMIGFLGEYTFRNILNRFNPFDTAEEILNNGKLDLSGMLAFEDVTWDSVFANLKTVEFSSSSPETNRSDMSYYFDFADMIHELDADDCDINVSVDIKGVGGQISARIFSVFMEKIKETLSSGEQSIHIKGLIDKIPSIVKDAVIEYISEFITDNIEKRLETDSLFSKIDDVCTKIEYDELGMFKLSFASVVKGTEVLICNPEYYQLGDRIKSALKYFISGASVDIGGKLSEKIRKMDFLQIEKYAPGLLEYLPTLIATLAVYTVVICLDRNETLCKLINAFNKVPTLTGNIAYYRENAAAFEQMAADLSNVDFDELKKQIEFYNDMISKMFLLRTDEELNQFLLKFYRENNKMLPWGNRTLEEHWADKNSRLIFS